MERHEHVRGVCAHASGVHGGVLHDEHVVVLGSLEGALQVERLAVGDTTEEPDPQHQRSESMSMPDSSPATRSRNRAT